MVRSVPVDTSATGGGTRSFQPFIGSELAVGGTTADVSTATLRYDYSRLSSLVSNRVANSGRRSTSNLAYREE